MKGYIMDKDGVSTPLPEFLSWDVCHGMGEPCDWFEVSFIYYSSQLPKLQTACSFRATHDGAIVFSGVIDEYSISIDEKGSVVTLSGRSKAALLLDNELPSQEYPTLGSAAAVASFVSPYGISSVIAGSSVTLSAFSVRTGESAWSALKRFCRYAWETIPYFTKDGTLILNGRSGNTITVDASKDVSSIAMCDERYGIISDISVRNRVTGASYTSSNTAFAARGGKCHREMTVPKTTGADAVRYTAAYQIAESQRCKKCVKLTLTKQFACFPGDRVNLTASKLGISGVFTVLSSHCWADSLSAGTIITLEV